jgi:xylitol oxidase
MIDLRNWAGNHAYQAARLHGPTSVDEVCEIVARSPKVKALGSRHSFNDVADTIGDLISLEKFDQIDEPDRERSTVTIGGGVRYGPLCGFLHQRGFALHNLASLPHISVAGACATGTHGSGDCNGNLATAVRAIEVVTADGKVRRFTRDADGDRFNGMVVNLGALGVVTQLMLDIVPTFHIRQDVYENLPVESLADHFDEVTSASYSVSLFTDWKRPRFNQVWLKRRADAGQAIDTPRTRFGATLAPMPLHPIAEISPVNCTEQMGVTGAWHDRLPHFRMDFTPSAGDELQTDYMVPRQHAMPALRAIDRLRDRIAPVLQISEIRTVAADDLWMSPCNGRSSVSIHFTWKPDGQGVRELLPIIETELAGFDARPHWGKLFSIDRSRLESLYPRLGDFRQLISEFDPHRKFANAFLVRNVV